MTAMSSLTSTLPSAAEADAAIEQLTSSSSSSSTSSSEGHDFIMNVLNYATSYQSYHLDDGHESGKISAASSNPVSTSAETKTNNDDTSTATTATTTVLDKTGNNNNDNKNNAIIKEQQLMFQKSNEASDFIIQSIHRYFTNLKNKSESESNQDEDDHEKDGEDSNMEDVQSTIDEKTMKDKMEKLENEIIDLLWYVGMILEPTEPFQPPKQQTQQQAVKTTTTPSRKQGGVVHNTISSIHYKAFCIFIEQLHKNDILPTDKLANRLEVSTLGSLNGVIPKVIPKPNQTKPYAIPSVDPTDSKSSIVTRSQKNYFFVQLRKTQTSEIYRQKRFNLLQEESEGYAKLFNFLNGGLLMRYGSSGGSGGSGAATGGGLNANGNNSNDNCVHDDSLTMEEQIDNVKDQITAYIGTFDLDPNRCLDITLDVLECQIKSMISSSSNVKTSMFDLVRHAPEYAYCVSLLLGIISMFPIDNVTHLIGFKFSNYKGGGSSSISDSKATAGTKTKKTTPAKPTSATKEPVNAHTTAPKSLFYTTAILASHDYLSLLTLKLHLAPSLNSIEEQYQLWRDEYMTKLRKKGTISLNASKDATAANKNKDNGNGNGSASIGHNNSQTRSFCDSNQLIQMLNIMIEIGLPWDMICTLFQDYDVPTNAPNDNLIIAASSMYSPLERNLCKYVKHLISDIYDTKVKVTGMDLKCNSSTGKGSSSTHVFGKYTLLPATQTHQHSLSESVTLLEFCDSIVKPLVPLVVTGAISSDPTLYCQICRLFRVFLKERLSSMKNTETKIVEIIQEDSIFFTLRSFIIPSLSLFPYNPAISSEVWSVISILPYEIRYAMYAFWREHGLEKAALRGKRHGLFPRKPLKQTESEIKTSLETKYMLKRMSKDNVRDMGKQISKVSHNNPLVVFTLILNQIESYDNLISIMVETFQFMGNLSLDVMGYCLLVSLGGGEKQLNRSKLKDDGVNVAQWMSSLETFTGAFYKKFTVVEMKGLLSYFTKQLHLGHNLELGVLRSLLKMAGGYGFADTESIAKLNQSQLDGRGGSLLLKRETSDFGIVTSVDYTSSRNLRTSLQDDSCGVTLLILLSQLKTRILFENAKNKPKQIKLLGSHYDNCQRTMNLLLAFLVDGSEDNKKTQKRGAIQNYAEAIPNLGTILRDFGIAAPTAWMLCRPLLRAATFISQDAAEGTLNEKNVSDLPQYLQNYHPYSEGVIDACREMIPESNWNHITPLVYQRFFTYQISDLFFPEEQYKANIARLCKSIQELEQLQKGGLQAAGMHAARTANAAAAGATQKDIKQAAAFSREDEDKLKQMRFNSDTLGADMKRQKATCESVFNALKGEKDKFFQGLKGENDIVVSTKVFLAKCLYPRCLQSADDALYCAHFVQLLHKIQTPGFHTLQLLDDIVNAMVGALYSTTEDESSCLGIFFEIIWKNICAWRYNSELYEKEVLNTPGALWTEIKIDNGRRTTVTSSLSHSDYMSLYDKWHLILGTTFIGCVNSKEYMHNRTGLILLTRLVNNFPTKSTLGEKLLEELQPLQDDSNPLHDIKAMAQAYSAQLSKARSDGVWKEENKKAAKEREIKEKQIQEEKRIQREKNLEEMQKESKDIDKQLGRETRPGRPHSQMTPQQSRVGERNTVPQRDNRGQRDQRQSDRSPPPSQQSMQGRWEKDNGVAQRGHDQGRRRDEGRGENRNQTAGDNDSTKSSLRGRWDNSRKRERSPDKNKSERDVKRSRRDASPQPQHRGLRRGRR